MLGSSNILLEDDVQEAINDVCRCATTAHVPMLIPKSGIMLEIVAHSCEAPRSISRRRASKRHRLGARPSLGKSTVDGRLREKSIVDGRLKEKSIVGDQLREKKGRRRRRGEEERRIGYIPPFPAPSSPAHCPHSWAILLPREETECLPVRGERSRRHHRARAIFAHTPSLPTGDSSPARGERSRR
ncbi:hypothetical protein BHE74_00003061, partial [Ensete ventricosum]